MTRGSVINESLIFVSYHNIDIDYAFKLSTLLIRYYRNIWLDRFEIEPSANWQMGIGEARKQATAVIAIVSDDYLQSDYCRSEFEYFRERGITVTAVIARNFSTEMIAGFTFNDWVDFRRWFDDPNDLSVENLLSQIPQSESVPQTGERPDYLRQFIQQTELALTRMPTSRAALRNSEAPGAGDIRPRMVHTGAIKDWEFVSNKAGNEQPLEDLLSWSQNEAQFVIRGEPGSGKTYFARLLTLAQAHKALHDEQAALPIWIDLSHWDDSVRSFDTFMEAHWPLLSFWQHWLVDRQAFFVLDNWADFCRSYPDYASEITSWIDASPNQRFIFLSTRSAIADPKRPSVRFRRMTVPLAQKFAAGYLTLDQQNSFRQILRQNEALIEDSQLAYLSIGIELLSSDRSLAFNQWQKDPIAALVRLRCQQIATTLHGLRADEILRALRSLAWSMMLQDKHRFMARADAERQGSDIRVIDWSLETGLLVECGKQIRFESELIQRYLASENLKKDGLVKVLTRPDFEAGSGRKPKKWDKITLLVVDSLSEENRLRVIDQIADIDPFLAGMCLRRHPEHNNSYQETLIKKLVQLCAQNSSAQGAFRAALSQLTEPLKTAELLIGQMSQLSNPLQLWLWYEICALPLELPVNFIDLVSSIGRDDSMSVADQVSKYSLSQAVAFLVKLSQHHDVVLRRNAIWMLGELKYLPTAILLLDYLETAERDDLDEVVLTLMKYAYSEILARVLRWSQDNPDHRDSVITALATRKRQLTSRLLSFADARRLTLNPEFYDIVVNTDEREIAIGLAQIAAPYVDLPEPVDLAVLSVKNGRALHKLIAAAIKHLPNRDGFQQLMEDIAQVLRDPPETTVIAGSNIDALLYGPTVFDEITAQAVTTTTSKISHELLIQLQHSDWRQRHRAVNGLIGFPAGDALPHLLEATDDDSKPVRLAAHEILSKFEGEVAAQTALIAALSDPDSEVVVAVTALLQSISLTDYDVMIDLLDSENPGAVAAAIAVLGDSRQRQAAAELSGLLDDQRQPAQGGPTIGQRAREAIDRLNASVMTGDGSHDVSMKTGSGGLSNSPAFSDAEKVMRTLDVLRDDDWGRTQKAAKFLRRFTRHLRGRDNPEIRRLLCTALSDENWSVRWAAAEALAMLHDQAAIPQLGACLNDSSWIVQVAVVRALVELSAVKVVAQLVPLLQSRHKSVREAAAEALGELKDPLAISPLGRALKREPDDFVRLAALKSIWQISPAEARTWLEYALSDSYLHSRIFALKQLAPEMDDSDIPILRQLLEDHEKPSWEGESLRELAIQVLQRIDSAQCRALLDSLGAAENRAGA